MQSTNYSTKSFKYSKVKNFNLEITFELTDSYKIFSLGCLEIFARIFAKIWFLFDILWIFRRIFKISIQIFDFILQFLIENDLKWTWKVQ